MASYQRCVSVLVVILDVRTGLEKEPHDALVPTGTGVHEGGVAWKNKTSFH